MASEERTRPTPERMRMARGEFEDVVIDTDEHGRKVSIATVRMLDRNILAQLVRDREISGDQFHAGAKFYEDWFLSGMANSGTIDPAKDVVDGGRGGLNESERRMAARERYHRAIKALCSAHGRILQCCVLDDADGGESLAHYGMRVFVTPSPKLGRRDARNQLRDALSALDEHYNGKRQHRYRQTHASDYRPAILTDWGTSD